MPVIAVARYRLTPSARGTCQLWKEPEEGRSYVIGSDTAGGGSGGDFSVACVIDAETCALVAMWRDRMSPMPWGRAVSRLGWYYNEAFVAFETGASAHGLAACHAAIGYGYRKLYKRQNLARADQPQGEQLGWPTTPSTKPIMIARVQEALEQDLEIPSELLLRELSEQRWVESATGRKMKPEKHDDMTIAYSIALCVRDRAWTSGLIKPTRPVVKMNESERFWYERERREHARPRQRKYA